MINKIKKIIKKVSDKDINFIVNDLLNCEFYCKNVKEFFKFFGFQGGTIWQLAGYILEYKNKRGC